MGLLRRLSQLLLFVVLMFSRSINAWSLPAEHYATTSRLSSGKWIKIAVSNTGMQRLTYAQLRSMGFSNPERVNVYGYGGQRHSEMLNASTPDDLPIQPVIREGDALCFWGVNTIDWSQTSVTTIPWRQVQNPYSTESCYFLSDSETNVEAPKSRDCRVEGGAIDAVSTFVERVFHEKELYNAAQMGTLFWGEDFRTIPSQTFTFNLPGRANDKAMVAVSFGVKTSGGSSSISVSANGTKLAATNADNYVGLNDSEKFYTNQISYKEVTDASEKLNLTIDFRAGGALQFARLDYITVNYERKLTLDANGYLYFNTLERELLGRAVTVDGCTSSTKIWDVTNPASPFEIVYTLNGSKGTFMPAEGGNREYVAFTPSQVNIQPTKVGIVSNQNLHSMTAPDMVIFSPEIFKAQAERVADLHRRLDDMDVVVLTPEVVYNEFSSGSPELTAYRKLLKMWYDKEGKPGYCLIFGRPTYDNRGITDAIQAQGYPHMPIWQSADSRWAQSSYSTDDYIAMLDDNNTELIMGNAQLRVKVGRMPVKSESEAREVVDKLIRYVENPDYGAWRNNIMIIADDQDRAIHLDQAEDVYSVLTDTERGRSYRYDRLYLDSYPRVQTGTGAGYPDARDHFYRSLDQGVMYIDYIGHANPKSWTHEGFLRYEDIVGMSNTRLPIICTFSCEFINWDSDDISGGEMMFLNPKAGAIAMIGASRPSYMSPNGNLNRAMSRQVTAEDNEIVRLGDIYLNGKNAMKNDNNKLLYLLMGDPAMRLPRPTNKVVVDFIGEHDLSDTKAEAAVLAARSRVKISGRVTDMSGNTLDTYNGTLVPMLYDAERVVETYGNGSEGEKRMYNDRKNLLYTGNVKVEQGRWETTILMPSEIDNNFSPALLSLYASSAESGEAHGYTDKLYVYGWDDSIVDEEGPEIIAIGLNNTAFKNGGVVNTTPVFLSTVRDESGINISQAGIGHRITLSVDGTTVYDDLTDYYEADAEDATVGHIRYLLPEQSPGDHEAKLTVWDNAGNSTVATLNYRVSLTIPPTIYDVTPDVNSASTSVTFTISHDRPQNALSCNIEVYDLTGRKIWEGTSSANKNSESTTTWNLTDSSGNRVPRGIYLYRARVKTADGIEATKTKKLAVTAG